MLVRRWAHNGEGALIGGGKGGIDWKGKFSSFSFFVFFWGRGGGGGGGVKSNNYTNKLKLRLSFPRIVEDDYPSNGTKYL